MDSEPVQFGGLEGALRANAGNAGETRGKNPMEGASLLSRALFLWVNPLMALGNVKVLQAADLPQLQDDDSAATLGMRLRRRCRPALVLGPIRWCKLTGLARA